MRAHELDELAHVERLRESDLLEDRSDGSAGRRLARVEALQVCAPAVRATQSEHGRDGGRLPCAVRAEQREHLARAELEVDPVQRPDGPEGLDHSLETGGSR